MMTRLMTWFIELQNKFNESRLFKILTIYVLNQVNDLTSWHYLTTKNWDHMIYTDKTSVILRKHQD